MSEYLKYETRGDKLAPTPEAVFKFIMLLQWQDLENFCAAIEARGGSVEGSRARLKPDHIVRAYHGLYPARPAPAAPAAKTVEQQHGELTK